MQQIGLILIVVLQLIFTSFSTSAHGQLQHQNAQQSEALANSHHFLHHIGQPHEHSAEHPDAFKISYSDAALEHSNPNHDRGLPVLATLSLPHAINSPALNHERPRLQLWVAPILSHLKPPPRPSFATA